ncbi:uncharacterized protein LOC126904870 [Daktulosphaira vitifoliae]|uniref:uncharacterized protein LOC126904870 n=1 Tax=Daktulosphaira vitifoliae TaxID=58002 RepID=UPI0021AA29FB|nr:uncharacterized protein LOC126904870 [Daktulosphaira vitifoliae]XP_050540149.1 uncharacterized protein LOC126904870 [Daktulosphaira vitifoliae]
MLMVEVFTLILFYGNIVMCVDDRITQLKNLLAYPGWKVLENTKILDSNNFVTEYNTNIINENYDEAVRKISIIYTCMISGKIKDLMVLLQKFLMQCWHDEKSDNIDRYYNCAENIITSVRAVSTSLTHVLNALMFLYHLSPTFLDIRLAYKALLTLKLYTDRKSELTPTFKSVNGIVDKITINKELNEMDWILSLATSYLQMYDIEYCDIDDIKVNNCFYKIPDNEILCTSEESKLLIDTLKDNILNMNRDLIKLYFEMGFTNYSKVCTCSTFKELNLIWFIMQENCPEGLPNVIPWFGEIKDVSEVKNDIRKSYDTAGIALYQKSTLIVITQIFYTKILNCIQNIKNKIKFEKASYLGTLQKFFNFPFFESSSSTSVLTKSRQTNNILEDFWKEIQSLLLKFKNNLLLPEDIQITLTVMDILITDLTTHEKYEQINEKIVDLLNRRLKTTGLDLNIKLSETVEDDLLLLDNFINEFVKMKIMVEGLVKSYILFKYPDHAQHSLNNVIKIIHQVLPKNNFCDFTFKLIELFNYIDKLLERYIESPTMFSLRLSTVIHELERLSQSISKNTNFILNKDLSSQHFHFTNALILMLLYTNNINEFPIKLSTNQGDQRFVIIEQLKRLNMLIINQFKLYSINNCYNKQNLKKFCEAEIKAEDFQISHLVDKCLKILNNIDLDYVSSSNKSQKYINSCDFSLYAVMYGKLFDLTDEEKTHVESINHIKFQWKGSYNDIYSIRLKVLNDLSAKSVSEFQVLIENTILSLILGYILNILQCINHNYNCKLNSQQINTILFKMEQLEGELFSFSKFDDLADLFDHFRLFISFEQPSKYISNILIVIIENKLLSYRADLKTFYEITKQNAFERDCDIDDIIQSLINYIDIILNIYMNDIKCVTKHLKLNL